MYGSKSKRSPFLSILTPYPGTASYEKLRDSGRLRQESGWEFYNGYNVSFIPRKMSPADLLRAHRDLWRSAFSVRPCLGRLLRAVFTLRWGALLMCTMMNVFYGLKALTNNEPISFEGTDHYKFIREVVGPIMHGSLDSEQAGGADLASSAAQARR